MITLITGVPGAGKTLYCVDQILRAESAKGRQLFVDGIPDLQIPHEVAGDINDWHSWAPEGAHIVIDEVQRHWRPEAAGKAVPPAIAELETHRHRGLDFTILTQGPTLVHANVRRLVGRHIHIRRTALGVYAYEWTECKNAPDSAWKSAIAKVKFPHPKRSFGLYKSASLHTKVSFRIPKVVYLVGLGLAVLPFLLWGIYSILSKPLATISVPGQTAAASQSTGQGSVLTGGSLTPQTSSSAPSTAPALVKEVDIREQFIPRIYGEPWTAPAYDGVRVVRNMPKVVACLATEDKCSCYTEQMTVIQMTDAQCRERLDGGGVYDPYNEQPKPSSSQIQVPVDQLTKES